MPKMPQTILRHSNWRLAKAMKRKARQIWYWHIHHKALCEPLLEPIENRIEFIKAAKPADEVETRLRLMRPVRGKIPVALARAGAALHKAYAAWQKAYAAWHKAYAAWQKAYAALQKAYAALQKAYTVALPALEKLHAQECPNCSWDGKTIFPKKET